MLGSRTPSERDILDLAAGGQKTTTLDTLLVTNHSQGLSGLAPNTLYHYRVKSRDETGNLRTSADFTFTTAADTTAPVISNVNATLITQTGATITWTTDEPADSQVEYGTMTSYGQTTTLDISLVTNHSQTLSGLTANTLDHYRVKSRDASGNLQTSADFEFATAISGTTLSVTVLPGAVTLGPSQTHQFIAHLVPSENHQATWSIAPAVGQIVNGIYTAPSTIASSQNITVTATSSLNPCPIQLCAEAGGQYVAVDREFPVTATSGQVLIVFTSVVDNAIVNAIEIAPSIGVTVSPLTKTLVELETQQFTAMVTGTFNTAVTWSLSPAVGTISSGGLYTAPLTISQSQQVTVTATSVADSTRSASASVTLLKELDAAIIPGAIAAYAFEEGTGDVLTDVTGNGKDGVLGPGSIDDPVWGTGYLTFNVPSETGQRVHLPDNVFDSMTVGDFTIQALLRTSNTSGYRTAVGFGYRGDELFFGHYESKADLYTNGIGETQSTGAFPVGTWYVLSMVRNGTNLLICFDKTCESKTVGASNIAIGTDETVIGSGGFGGPNEHRVGDIGESGRKQSLRFQTWTTARARF